MGRGEAKTGGDLLYGSTARLRSSAPTRAELDQTLMRIAHQVHGDEFWDDTITPHDIRRKYSRYDESPRQQEVHLGRVISKFHTLEAEGMIELDHAGEEPAWHSYRLTPRGEEIGARLVEADHQEAIVRMKELGARMEMLDKAGRPEAPPVFDEDAMEKVRRRAEEVGPEGVTSL